MTKYILKKLWRRKFTALGILVQFALCLALCALMLSTQNELNFSRTALSEIYGDVKFSALKDVTNPDYLASNVFEAEDGIERLASFCTWFTGNNSFRTFSVWEYPVQNGERIFAPESALKSYNALTSIYSYNAIKCDAGYADLFGIRVSKGRAFTAEDFLRQDEMPVILGASYNGYYNLNDVIYIDRNPYQPFDSMRVIGFLAPEQYLPVPKRANRMALADDFMLCPAFAFDSASQIGDYDMRIFQSYITGADRERAKQEINEHAAALRLYEVELEPPVNPATSYVSSLSNLSDILRLVFSVAFTMATLGIAASVTLSVKLQLRDLGCLILCGASKWRVLRAIALQYAVYMVIAYLSVTFITGALGISHAGAVNLALAGVAQWAAILALPAIRILTSKAGSLIRTED